MVHSGYTGLVVLVSVRLVIPLLQHHWLPPVVQSCVKKTSVHAPLADPRALPGTSFWNELAMLSLFDWSQTIKSNRIFPQETDSNYTSGCVCDMRSTPDMVMILSTQGPGAVERGVPGGVGLQREAAHRRRGAHPGLAPGAQQWRRGRLVRQDLLRRVHCEYWVWIYCGAKWGFSHRQGSVKILTRGRQILTWRPMENVQKMVQSVSGLAWKFWRCVICVKTLKLTQIFCAKTMATACVWGLVCHVCLH